jgi:hypothetical protein
MRWTHLFAALLAIIVGYGIAVAAPTVITLTQTGCQFLEPEGVDHQFKTRQAADCKAINQQNGEARLNASPPWSSNPASIFSASPTGMCPMNWGFICAVQDSGASPCPKSPAAA